MSRKKTIYSVSAILAAIMVMVQIDFPASHAMEPDGGTQNELFAEEENFSKEENVITEYFNEDDQEQKQIIWAQGVNPPKMGGADSEFKRETLNDPQGNPLFIEYKVPYIPNKGWYDVNKTEDREGDQALCFAAAASNMLHWWLEQNSEYIGQYLEKNPDAPKREELESFLNSFKSQSDSAIYKMFFKYYAYNTDGYWSDILVDLFINGYPPKKGGGTNHSDADKEKLEQNGPDERGGFFYNIFETTLLTERRSYFGSYDLFSREVKELLLAGKLMVVDYQRGNSAFAHVITIWGAEFNTDGKLSAIYVTDSDDDKSQGMMRYMVKNIGGRPAITTKVSNDNVQTFVNYLQIISSGKEIWEEKLNGKQPEKYQVTVNGGYASASNAREGEKVTITAEEPEGEQFVRWNTEDPEVLIDQPESPETTFIMPANNVEITAEFKVKEAEKYEIKVNGGHADTIKAQSGQRITITAEEPSDQQFVRWNTKSEGVVFENAESVQTTFVMPENDVEIAAEFRIKLPEAVTNLKSVSDGKQKVKLTWDASAGAEGYLIYAQKDGKYGYAGMTTRGTTFTDKKALDTDYNYYWVFPYVTDIDSGKMLPGKCTKYVWAKGVIPAVQNLKASSVKGGVKLTWTEQKDAEGYLVYGQRAGGKYGYVGMTTKGTTFTDKEASKTAYNYYWVFPYHKDSKGKMIVGGTPKYTYGRAL